jgi:transcriptional regulator with XRE-family HTH domain
MSTASDADSAGLGTLLGPRLRERRSELGKTLSAVADEAGLSKSYLSAIEKGGSVPSLTVLARLAHALEISLSEILRSSGSARLARGRIADPALTADVAAEGSQLQIVRQSAAPGDAGPTPVELGHGDVFVYLHSGRLEVTLDDGVFALDPGDALHCDRPRTIGWRVLGGENAVSLWVTARSRARA